jgi:transcription antitermination factor NusG
LRWAVLLTQPNRERTAEREVCAQGYGHWFPRVSPTEMLFPRYGFVQIEPQDVGAWRPLLSTRGVSDLLREAGLRPMVLPESGPGSLEPIRARSKIVDYTDDGEPIEYVVLPPRYIAGDRVLVEGGLYDGVEALYEGMPRRGRAAVLLSMLGASVPFELDERRLSLV